MEDKLELCNKETKHIKQEHVYMVTMMYRRLGRKGKVDHDRLILPSDQSYQSRRESEETKPYKYLSP